jgi:hypothetical protein
VNMARKWGEPAARTTLCAGNLPKEEGSGHEDCVRWREEGQGRRQGGSEMYADEAASCEGRGSDLTPSTMTSTSHSSWFSHSEVKTLLPAPAQQQEMGRSRGMSEGCFWRMSEF